MIEIAKILERLLSVLIVKKIINQEEAEYILEPLKEAENE